MESKETTTFEASSCNDRLQSMISNLSNWKVDFVSEKEECKKLRDVNLKLELELKDTRELEKSHRYHLQASREMIGNLQETVSQLVYLKRDVKKLRDEIISKDITIASLEKDKENNQQAFNGSVVELRKAHERHIEELIAINDRKLQQAQYDSDTKSAHFTCVIEELRSNLRDMEKGHMDKMNVVVLECEEKVQRSSVQVSQLQEQLVMQTARADANIEAYRRKLEDLEEKLKKSQFKGYLAQSIYPLQNSNSQYENRVEHPYSLKRDAECSDFNSIPVCPSPQPTVIRTPNLYGRNYNTPKLEVMYNGNRTQNLSANEKKGQFKITKKRKLYSDKDFLD